MIKNILQHTHGLTQLGLLDHKMTKDMIYGALNRRIRRMAKSPVTIDVGEKKKKIQKVVDLL